MASYKIFLCLIYTCICIRRIVNRQDRLSVGYCEERLVFKKDINPFIPLNHNEYSAKFLLEIVASKFISYLSVKSSSIATKDDFRQTTLTELRALPVAKIPIEKQSEIIRLVDKILANGFENSIDSVNEINH
jgi:hypothetical protein